MQMYSNSDEKNTQANKEELSFAGFLPRFVAYLIDFMVVGIASFFIKYIMFSELTQVEFFNQPLIFSYSIMDIFSWMLTLTYFIISIYCTETTLGKYIMRLKVVKCDGSKLSLFNIIYRETIGKFLSSILSIGYILIIFDKEKAALHDKLCDSRVIYACNVKKTIYVKRQYVSQPYVNPQYQPYNPPQGGHVNVQPQPPRPQPYNMPQNGPVNVQPQPHPQPYNPPQGGSVNEPKPQVIEPKPQRIESPKVLNLPQGEDVNMQDSEDNKRD